jgi:predicted RNase H-like nuclease (RuvC/YqgF family)
VEEKISEVTQASAAQAPEEIQPELALDLLSKNEIDLIENFDKVKVPANEDVQPKVEEISKLERVLSEEREKRKTLEQNFNKLQELFYQ